jgi:diguanylate cyclase (GGDEF)-like protein
MKAKADIEKKEIFKRLIEAMPDGLVFVDKRNETRIANKAFHGQFGDSQEVLEKIQKTARSITKSKKTADENMTNDSGNSFEVKYAPVNGAKNPIGVVATSRDITKHIFYRHSAETQLKILSELTSKDGLTGLYNHIYFYSKLEEEFKRSKRYNLPLSLIFFDVDRFKEYNFKYGHRVGDKILIALGEMIKEEIRENIDSGCRYGGDEFAIILPNTNITRAEIVAERMRIKFKNSKFNSTTLSIGIADIGSAESANEMVDSADRFMYMAKKAGGNQIKTPAINLSHSS